MESVVLHGIQNTFGHPWLDAVLPYFTQLGQAGVFWIVVALALLCMRRYRFWGAALLVALAAVGLLNELALKAIVARPRPFLADPSIQLLVRPPSGYSFPSGHTGTAFAAATVLGFSPLARGWKASAWVLAFALAFSRLYLFVHYPSDVLAGALLGILYGTVVVKATLAIARKREIDAGHARAALHSADAGSESHGKHVRGASR